MGWRSQASLSTLGVALVASGIWAGVGVAQVAAAEASLNGVVVTGKVTSTPNSFWFGQMNRDGVCDLMPGCVRATGAGSNWVLTIQMPVSIPGSPTIDVNVKVTDEVLLKSMSMDMTYAGPYGDLTAKVNVDLKPSGGDTTVTLTLDKVEANGILATGIPSFGEALKPRMTEAMARLSNDRDIAGTKVRLKVSKRGVARVVVTGTGLGRPAPVASGTVFVVADGKVVCTSSVRRSRGSCRLPKLAPGTEVRATVVGDFDNGYPIWNSDADQVKK